MINITKLNGQKMTVNCELIETMEETPDTTITMTTGNKLIARESINELVAEVISYKKGYLSSCGHGSADLAPGASPPPTAS